MAPAAGTSNVKKYRLRKITFTLYGLIALEPRVAQKKHAVIYLRVDLARWGYDSWWGAGFCARDVRVSQNDPPPAPWDRHGKDLWGASVNDLVIPHILRLEDDLAQISNLRIGTSSKTS